MRTLGAAGSHISSPKKKTCLAESVDEEVCYTGTISWISINTC